MIPPHALTNFEIQKYYRNEPRFNGVYSRDNLPKKTKDAAYVINPGDYSDIGTHSITLYILNNKATYFDRFEVEHIPRDIKKFADKSTIVTQIFLEYKHMAQLCVVIFVFDLFILCLKGKA